MVNTRWLGESPEVFLAALANDAAASFPNLDIVFSPLIYVDAERSDGD